MLIKPFGQKKLYTSGGIISEVFTATWMRTPFLWDMTQKNKVLEK
jgi:hypothetical protein